MTEDQVQTEASNTNLTLEELRGMQFGVVLDWLAQSEGHIQLMEIEQQVLEPGSTYIGLAVWVGDDAKRYGIAVKQEMQAEAHERHRAEQRSKQDDHTKAIAYLGERRLQSGEDDLHEALNDAPGG